MVSKQRTGLPQSSELKNQREFKAIACSRNFPTSGVACSRNFRNSGVRCSHNFRCLGVCCSSNSAKAPPAHYPPLAGLGER
eukprot:15471342-Alexandrium_andersonii.AAC.1